MFGKVHQNDNGKASIVKFLNLIPVELNVVLTNSMYSQVGTKMRSRTPSCFDRDLCYSYQ